jgi:PRC-barrel domain protein
MPHYGLLGKHELVEAIDDVRGATLYGRDDEKLGKIDDVIFNHGTGDIGYIVLDTGGWLTTKKFIVPATAVGIGARWDTFPARLRERRKEAVAGCRTCSVGPASVKGSGAPTR